MWLSSYEKKFFLSLGEGIGEVTVNFSNLAQNTKERKERERHTRKRESET